MLLGFVLGKLMEENLRRALIISRGDRGVPDRQIDAVIFGQPVGIPLSGILLAIAAGLLIIALLPSIRKGRDEVFVRNECAAQRLTERPGCGIGPGQPE